MRMSGVLLLWRKEPVEEDLMTGMESNGKIEQRSEKKKKGGKKTVNVN